jgi:hypothetical protein
MIFVLFWLLFAVAVGVYASNRGRSGFGWFFLSLIISPLLGIIFCAVSKDLSKAGKNATEPSLATHVKCPACAELVLPEAKVCKHCGHALTPDPGFAQRQLNQAKQEESEDNKNLMIGIGAIAFLFIIAAIVNWIFP